MKKHVWLTILILVTVIFAGIATAQAEIIPPYGEGQIGLSSVVLCESLTIREAPNANAGILDSLEFGRRIIVMKQEEIDARELIADAEKPSLSRRLQTASGKRRNGLSST